MNVKLRKTVSAFGKPKHFVATGLVVDLDKEGGSVLLIKHKKIKTWLPPGGHVNEKELPDECVVREVKEETGLDVEIVSAAFDVAWEKVETLHNPVLVQLEEIAEGHPQHLDLQYLCKVIGGKTHEGFHREHEGIKWFSERELKETEGLQNDVVENSLLALDKARELRERGSF
ncbi:MAG: NUDIX domain-containing protein [Candidatus Micrarchaeota archaeon]